MKEFLKNLAAATAAFVLLLASVVVLRLGLTDALPTATYGLHGLSEPARFELVFVGSSRSRQGYDPRVFEAAGCDAYVLAYNGLSPALAPAVVEAAMAYPSTSGALWIVEASAEALVRPPALQDTRLFLQLPLPQKISLIKTLDRLDRGFDAGDMLNLLLRTDNELLLSFPILKPFLDSGSYRGGYSGAKSRRLDAAAFERAVKRRVAGERTTILEAQAQGWEAIHSLFAKGVDSFMLVQPPMPEPVARQAHVSAATKWLRDWSDARQLSFLDGSEMINTGSPELFSDATHLSSKGRSLYSESLADWMGRQFPDTGCRSGDFGR